MEEINLKEKAKKLKETGKFYADRYMINVYDIARNRPKFTFLLESEGKDLENKLKVIATAIGPFSIIGGTTEFDVPRFLRRENYEMGDEETLKRLIHLEQFATYEAYVTQNKIEQRRLWCEKIKDKIHYFEQNYIRTKNTKPKFKI